MVPPMVPLTVMVWMLPVLREPLDVTLPMVLLEIVPEPELPSSGAETLPERVPTLRSLMVPWPAAVMVPPMVPVKVMVWMLPVRRDPPDVTLAMVLLEIGPEPELPSSGAETLPERVP